MTGYAEFTNNSNYEQDQVNLQYSQYITRTVFRGNRVRQMIHANLDRLDEGEKVDNKDVTNRRTDCCSEACPGRKERAGFPRWHEK